MSKIARLFTVDTEVYEKARAKGINLSEAAELGLRSVVKMKDVRKKAENYSPTMQKLLEAITDEDMMKCQEAVKRNGQFAKGWVQVFLKSYGIEVSRKELLKVFG